MMMSDRLKTIEEDNLTEHGAFSIRSSFSQNRKKKEEESKKRFTKKSNEYNEYDIEQIFLFDKEQEKISDIHSTIFYGNLREEQINNIKYNLINTLGIHSLWFKFSIDSLITRLEINKIDIRKKIELFNRSFKFKEENSSNKEFLSKLQENVNLFLSELENMIESNLINKNINIKNINEYVLELDKNEEISETGIYPNFTDFSSNYYDVIYTINNFFENTNNLIFNLFGDKKNMYPFFLSSNNNNPIESLRNRSLSSNLFIENLTKLHSSMKKVKLVEENKSSEFDREDLVYFPYDRNKKKIINKTNELRKIVIYVYGRTHIFNNDKLNNINHTFGFIDTDIESNELEKLKFILTNEDTKNIVSLVDSYYRDILNTINDEEKLYVDILYKYEYVFFALNNYFDLFPESDEIKEILYLRSYLENSLLHIQNFKSVIKNSFLSCRLSDNLKLISLNSCSKQLLLYKLRESFKDLQDNFFSTINKRNDIEKNTSTKVIDVKKYLSNIKYDYKNIEKSFDVFKLRNFLQSHVTSTQIETEPSTTSTPTETEPSTTIGFNIYSFITNIWKCFF